jgi:hypothetical protein
MIVFCTFVMKYSSVVVGKLCSVSNRQTPYVPVKIC